LHCGFVLNAKYQFGVLKNDKHWIVLNKKKKTAIFREITHKTIFKQGIDKDTNMSKLFNV